MGEVLPRCSERGTERGEWHLLSQGQEIPSQHQQQRADGGGGGGEGEGEGAAKGAE